MAALRAVETAEELAARAQGGSMPAFVELVNRFEPRIYNFLLRRVSAADAEDITQETMIRAWQRIHQYKPRWRFSTWIFTIATRLATTHCRRARPLALHEQAGPGAGEGAGPLAPMLRVETSSLVWRTVEEALGPEQRTALWLRYAEDLSMQEIATVMGKTPVGVRVMLHRARAVLAGRLAEGLGEAAGGAAELAAGISVRASVPAGRVSAMSGSRSPAFMGAAR